MKQMEERYGNHPNEVKKMITEELRQAFLIPALFSGDDFHFTYSHYDRMIIGGTSPKGKTNILNGVPFIVLCDDSSFTAQTLNNFLWVAFTRCNPSHDIHGIASFTQNKHWGCRGPLIIDARVKPHHAPLLERDAAVEKRVDRLFQKSGSLYGV